MSMMRMCIFAFVKVNKQDVFYVLHGIKTMVAWVSGMLIAGPPLHTQAPWQVPVCGGVGQERAIA